ncbi:hypothetical protein KKH36_04015 [Patescibacteria group bacterium]|nr:hypothetical protein [Patescibacteria group bacterium]
MKSNLNSFHLENFFTIREGLWVSDDFKEYISSVAKPIKKEVKTAFFDVFEKPMTDAEIRKSDSEDYVFKASEFCLCLKDKIVAQSEGEDGELLNNGFVNMFYVHGKNNKIIIVTIGWSTNLREWSVYLYRIDSHLWGKGNRVFYPTNT